MDVLCCCGPEKGPIGTLPEESTALKQRECSDGSYAFDSNHMSINELMRIEGFVITMGKKGKPIKTWKKK